MIRKKYPDLDLSDVDLTLIEGHDKHDLVNGFDPQDGQRAEKTILVKVAADQMGEEENRVGNKNVNFNPLFPKH